MKQIELNALKTKLAFIKKSPRPILGYVEVNDKGLTCTDLETYVCIKDSMGLAHGYQKLDTIGLVPSIQSDDYPLTDFNIEAPRDHVTVKLDELFYCLKFASSDETRLHLNGVAFDNGHMVAIDGHTLKVYKSKELSESYIVPRTSLKVLEGLVKAYKIKGEITISFDDAFAIIHTEHFKFKARLIKREFPKWSGAVPAKFTQDLMLTNLPALKDIKPLLNAKTNAVHIVCVDKKLSLKFPDHDNSYDLGEYNGDDFKIGINMKYVDRACNGEKTVNLKFNQAMAAIEINKAIVMPLKC